jgi:hypothetical protein
MRFKTVLDDMSKQDVVGNLRQLGDDVKSRSPSVNTGRTRWIGGPKTWSIRRGAVPAMPSPRAASPLPWCWRRFRSWAKPALKADDHKRQAVKLSGTQKGLGDRVDALGVKIRELPDGESEFAYEIGLLAKVSSVMVEATTILAQPETGDPAIAAETEAIELLLQSKRINPKGGGGGGATPGGGGQGKTLDSALALFGGGLNAKEVREDRGISQTTGDSGPSLPEEFRSWLDEYFNRLERNAGGQ